MGTSGNLGIGSPRGIGGPVTVGNTGTATQSASERVANQAAFYKRQTDLARQNVGRFGEGIDLSGSVQDVSQSTVDSAIAGRDAYRAQVGDDPFLGTGYGNASVTKDHELYKAGQDSEYMDSLSASLGRHEDAAAGRDQFMDQLTADQRAAQLATQGSASQDLQQQMAQQGIEGTQALVMGQMQERGQETEQTSLASQLAMTREERQRQANVEAASMAAQGRGLELSDVSLELQDKWNLLDAELQEKGIDIDTKFRNVDNLHKWEQLVQSSVNSYYGNEATKTQTDVIKDSRFEAALGKLDPRDPAFQDQMAGVYEQVYGIDPKSPEGQAFLGAYDYAALADASYNEKEITLKQSIGDRLLADVTGFYVQGVDDPSTPDIDESEGRSFNLFNPDGTMVNPAMERDVLQMFYNGMSGLIGGEHMAESDFIEAYRNGELDDETMAFIRSYSNEEFKGIVKSEASATYDAEMQGLYDLLDRNIITSDEFSLYQEGLKTLSKIDLLGDVEPTYENGRIVLKDSQGTVVWRHEDVHNVLAESTVGSSTVVGDIGGVTKVSANEYSVDDTNTTYRKVGDDWVQVNNDTGDIISQDSENFDTDTFEKVASAAGIEGYTGSSTPGDGTTVDVPDNIKSTGGIFINDDGAVYNYDASVGGDPYPLNASNGDPEEMVSIIGSPNFDPVTHAPYIESVIKTYTDTAVDNSVFIPNSVLDAIGENEDVLKMFTDSIEESTLNKSDKKGVVENGRSTIDGYPTDVGQSFVVDGNMYVVENFDSSMKFKGFGTSNKNDPRVQHYGQKLTLRSVPDNGENYYVLSVGEHDIDGNDHNEVWNHSENDLDLDGTVLAASSQNHSEVYDVNQAADNDGKVSDNPPSITF